MKYVRIKNSAKVCGERAVSGSESCYKISDFQAATKNALLPNITLRPYTFIIIAAQEHAVHLTTIKKSYL